MLLPTMDNLPAPIVNGYSLESSVAEKFEAIIHNGYLNSRYKDFYDIYVVSQTHSFSYAALKEAVTETFNNRNTDLTMDTSAFGDDFLNDHIHQTRWNFFLKKKKAMIKISLDDAISRIKTFLRPVVLSELDDAAKWNPQKGIWE